MNEGGNEEVTPATPSTKAKAVSGNVGACGIRTDVAAHMQNLTGVDVNAHRARVVNQMQNSVKGNGMQYGEFTIMQRVMERSLTTTGSRTSAFDRLSRDNVDECLKFKGDDKIKMAFADIVGGKQQASLQFFPLEDNVRA
ncbi:hypothetical protein L6452_42182 [Arctium lappa]|uniref:Uncharacterized protein n=1 Tax=Arctium lappa TaxID=4217 RepID=A0ACB8XI11_ARCLA|nr:hypothetical protein L6452_42182 [Arctium lappa]